MARKARKLLTDIGVKSATAGPERREIADAGCRGLYLVIQPTKAKSWALRYRFRGKNVKLTLGVVNLEVVGDSKALPEIGGALTLSEARIVAAAQRNLMVRGIDPGLEQKSLQASRQQAEADADRNAVKIVVADFLKRYVNAKGLRSADQVKWLFNKHVLPKWGEKDITTIRKRDVNELLDAIVDGGAPTMANRVFAAIRKLFNWAKGRGVVLVSPLDDMELPSAEVERDRVLTDDEIRLLWKTCETMGQPFGQLMQFLLLTGQRRDEAAKAVYGEFEGLDGKDAEWIIPAARAKNGKEHHVPLSAPAVALLTSIKRLKGKAGYVFTTTGETPVSGFSRAKEIADKKMQEALEDDVELARWTLHDLRRTAATGMAALGFPVHVVEAVLNHKSGKIKGVARVYNRYDYAKEKRQALEAWARRVESIVSEQNNDNVIELAART